jgi:hypothetical protein
MSLKGTSIGKKNKGAEEERRALFNTWLNACLLMPDIMEFQEMKVWLGLEKAAKVCCWPARSRELHGPACIVDGR